ncbi:hypothetical protein [Vibrio nomapromontoriensis]|uniref:hypothetical protein n=1 Tax=Vibrio nomapromontoriensis TaxID=2910246 RepID=UPI003D13E928
MSGKFRMALNNYLAIIFLLVITTVSGCGGDSGSPDPTHSPPEVSDRKPREHISIDDGTVAFSLDEQYYLPNIYNKIGNISYRFEPQGVVSDAGDGQLLIIKPGRVVVTAVDSLLGYEDSMDTFTLEIEKADNERLTANPLILSNIGSNISGRINVTQFNGQITYEILSGSEVVDVDSDGIVFAKLPGEATILVKDSGNLYFNPAEVEVHVEVRDLSSDIIEYRPILATYSAGLLLEPLRITGLQDYTESFRIKGPDTNVVNLLNAETGEMEVLKAGKVSIVVSVTRFVEGIESSFVEEYEFMVDIQKAERPDYLKIERDTIVYHPDFILSPTVENLPQGAEYSIDPDPEFAQDVIVIDTDTGLPKIQNASTSKLALIHLRIPENDFYKAYSGSIKYAVRRAQHPGIPNKSIQIEYRENLTIPLIISGAKGELTVDSNNQNVSLSGGEIVVSRVGDYSLEVFDDGGRNYLPLEQPFTLDLDVSPGIADPLPSLARIQMEFSEGLVINLKDQFIAQNLISSYDDVEVVSIDGANILSIYQPNSVRVLRDGGAFVTVRRPATDNFNASDVQRIYIVITSAESYLTFENGESEVSAIWSPATNILAPPRILGVKGELSYQFVDGSLTDVVQLDQDGQMKVLNAGVTQIRVNDNFRIGYSPSSLVYTVRVEKAENDLSLQYPVVQYLVEDFVMPTLTHSIMNNEGHPLDMTFELVEATNNNVSIIDSTSGKLQVNGAGDYTVKLTSWSRNFMTKTVTVQSNIERAEHPRIIIEDVETNYAPLKTIFPVINEGSYGDLVFGTHQIGSVASSTASINPNSGLLTTTNYPDSDLVVFTVYASESDNYQQSESSTFNVTVNPPIVSEANQRHSVEFNINNTNKILRSDLGNNGVTNNIGDTRFGIAGVRNVIIPTADDIHNYGQGIRVVIELKKEGEELTRPGLFYLTRHDGCNVTDNFSRETAIRLNIPSSCEQGKTHFVTKLISLQPNFDSLSSGVWKSKYPLTVYRYGERLFSQSEEGGTYVEHLNDECNVCSTPSKLYWWELVNVTLNI